MQFYFIPPLVLSISGRRDAIPRWSLKPNRDAGEAVFREGNAFSVNGAGFAVFGFFFWNGFSIEFCLY